MITGSPQHVLSQLTDAIYKHEDNTIIWTRDKNGIAIQKEVSSLPQCQTSGTSTQQRAHASQLAQKFINENL